MKYTHTDVEADRYKPVGSLFLSILDGDSIMPRVHRNEEARAHYDRSLANTALCLYDTTSTDVRDATPLRGRRHFAHHDDHFEFGVDPSTDRPRYGSRHGRRDRPPRPDQLSANLTPRFEEAEVHRQKRYVPEPRARPASATRPYLIGFQTSASEETPRAASAGRARSHSLDTSSLASSHLAMGSLVPRFEPPKERKVPEPMVLKPRTTGLRIFPRQRTKTFDELPHGIRMVEPQPHWRSVSDKQRDFLELGVDAQDRQSTPQHRRQTLCVVGTKPERSRSTEPAARGRAASPPTQRWRGGRSSSCRPPSRAFDIITGRPMHYK